jgi:subtilisin family serine protease
VLNSTSGARRIRHSDRLGHGTHVTSIAAGNGRDTSSASGGFNYIGVAPEADIVVVKNIDLDHQPVDGNKALVSNDTLFQDAISYILNIARNRPSGAAPVVINCSLSDSVGPHDGYTENEDYLTVTFDKNKTGQAFVTCAGNDGAGLGPDGIFHQQHAQVDLVPGVTVEIPLVLYDIGTAERKPLRIEFFYPVGRVVTAALKIPGTSRSFRNGPSLGDQTSENFSGGSVSMIHGTLTQHLRASGNSVNRNRFAIEVSPLSGSHRKGVYRLQLSATTTTTIHLWCDSELYSGFSVSTALLPAGVLADNLFRISANGGAGNIITVGAYNAELATKDVPYFSSPGPLVNSEYAASLTPPQDKPEIAAPGCSIDAARSRKQRSPFANPLHNQTIAESGTSASSPHVAGVIALMFERNPNMTLEKVREVLTNGATEDSSAPPHTIGAGRLDAKASFDLTPPP